MNIDIENLQKMLCQALCADIAIIPQNDRLMIRTPFLFADGDSYILMLEESSGGNLRLTDGGHTLMHLSYENDIDKFSKGTRGRLFNQVLLNEDVKEEKGELYIETSPSDLGTTIFRLSQTITSITDLTFLNRVRVESTFYEDLAEMLNRIVDQDKIQKDYIYPDIENATDYPIDYKIEAKADPLFVFGIPNRDKARLATIVLERLLRADAMFDSVLVFADQGAIPRLDVARLSNAGGEMIASLNAQDDLERKIIRKAA